MRRRSGSASALRARSLDGWVSANRADSAEAPRGRPGLGADRSPGRPIDAGDRGDPRYHLGGTARAVDRRAGRGFALSTIHDFYRRHRITFKKRRRMPASRAGRSRAAGSLVRSAARAGPGEARVSRRDRGDDQDGPPARAQPQRRTLPGRHPARSLEDDDPGRGPAPRRAHGADGHRRRDERRGLHRLCREVLAPDPQPRRHRRPGQPAGPQGQRRTGCDRARRSEALFLPPYSPDFNPIEQAFAKIKALLRRAAARTVDALEAAIAAALETFTPGECANYFINSGYEPD